MLIVTIGLFGGATLHAKVGLCRDISGTLDTVEAATLRLG